MSLTPDPKHLELSHTFRPSQIL